MITLKPLGAALFVLALGSCAFLPPSKSPPPTKPPSKPAPARAAVPHRPGAELAERTFSDLPPYSREYLTRVADAFAAGDARFLIEQGEQAYEQRVRPNVGAGEYLAYLYRVGGRDSDSPAGPKRPPRLDPAKVASLRYTGWDEQGPVLEVRARLRFKDGTETPCTLNVLWKLDPPRIVGYEP